VGVGWVRTCSKYQRNQPAETRAGAARQQRRLVRAVLTEQLERSAVDRPRQDVDDAAHRAAAVKRRERTAHHLHSIDFAQRQCRPVDRAAVGVVQRLPVEQHQHARLPVRAAAEPSHPDAHLVIDDAALTIAVDPSTGMSA
jgi:hypothetical protein